MHISCRELLARCRKYTQQLSDAKDETEHNYYRVKLKGALRRLSYLCDEQGILDKTSEVSIIRTFEVDNG